VQPDRDGAAGRERNEMTVVLAVRWAAGEGEEERIAGVPRRVAPAAPGCLQSDVHRDPPLD